MSMRTESDLALASTVVNSHLAFFTPRHRRRSMAKCWLDVLLSSPSLPHHSSSSLPHVSSPSLPCRDAPRHRVAFLVAGVARGFDRPRLQRAFLQHVV